MRTLLVVALFVFGCFGCKKSSEPTPPPAAAEPTAPAPQAEAPAPAAPATAPANTTPSVDGPTAGGLTWTAPAPFTKRTPKSSMRAAEYGIEGDTASELGVFYFGADQGGSIDANMERWIGQFTQPDGSKTKAKRDERTVNGIDVSLVEATGTFSGGMGMPGGPAPQAQENSMLLAAIAKGPNGPVFFKLTGPKAAVEHAREGFEKLVGSLKPAQP
jgi:hypothetical protein